MKMIFFDRKVSTYLTNWQHRLVDNSSNDNSPKVTDCTATSRVIFNNIRESCRLLMKLSLQIPQSLSSDIHPSANGTYAMF
jgi:hypothetical protein